MGIRKGISRCFRILLTEISPVINTKFVYWRTFGKSIDLKNPKTLDEKIMWLKLNVYSNNQLVTDCADKYRVREYVEKCGCGEILNELYFTYDEVEEIEWDKLPNKFVIKWNFGCGQNFICRDKAQLDIPATIKMLKEWKKEKDLFYKDRSEMQYKGIQPKLICEKLIESEDGGLPKDYKLYCFNGDPHCILVCANRIRAGHAEYYFFDKEWNLKRYNQQGKDAPEGFTLPKPKNFEKLFEYASILSQPFPFVRADFYLENGKVYFGELTFTPCGGLDKGRLPETQLLFGNMLNLSIQK
jgi:hypothetical protein